MPMPRKVWLPELQLTMVRRATARLPRNHFVFRTAPKWTKPEIKQFLQKAYGVKVARVATINYPRESRAYSTDGNSLREPWPRRAAWLLWCRRGASHDCLTASALPLRPASRSKVQHGGQVPPEAPRVQEGLRVRH